MNCYNCDKYLKEAIDSVLAQTYTNWEIIFWDNQSTDKSAEIVKSYNDKRIKYFYAELHTTLGEGRNKALEKVTGEFISFLDCDDLYLPQKLEKTLEYFKDDNIGLVYTNGYTLFEDKNIKKVFYKKEQLSGKVFELWLSSYQVMIPSVMFRKEILNSLEYWFDDRFNMIEEFDFFIRISKNSEVNYCHDKLCIWRAHSGSMTWTKKELFEKENKQFLEDILNSNSEIKDKNCIKKFQAKIIYQEFYNNWVKTKNAKRSILIPFFKIEKKLILVYLLSFFGLNNFNKFLKAIGKNV
jgi:glycosyltransferase involved in cell wall biosynthesis